MPSIWFWSARWMALRARFALLAVIQGDPLDVDGAVQARHELGHLQGLPEEGRAAVGGGGRLLAHERGQRELPAGHGVVAIFHEDDRQRHAHLGGVHDLGQPDGRQVAVALVADDDGVGVGDLVADGHGGGARPWATWVLPTSM